MALARRDAAAPPDGETGVDIGIDGFNVRLRVDGLSRLAREMLAGSIGEAA